MNSLATKKPAKRRKKKELIKRQYQAEATARKFHRNLKSKVRGIRGPIGSGKSVQCVIEIFRRCLEQEAGNDGVRRSRWAIVRNTYPELKSTTIKTWQDWIPDEVCHIKYDSPITGLLKLNLPDGTRVEAEILFMALDKPKDVKKLLSLELTGCWVNEAREIIRDIIDGVDSRVGRYPGKAYGAPITWDGIIMDTNPPDDKHWWAELERNTPSAEDDPTGRGWEFYVQPPALLEVLGGKYIPNPEAENAKHQQKGYDYWLGMLAGKAKEWINVYVLNQFGLLIDGAGVYKDSFRPTVHVSQNNLTATRHGQIYLGWDFGLTPAVIVGQIGPTGQVRILKEIVTDRMGLDRFVRQEVFPVLKQEYDATNKNCQIISVGDPSGVSWDTEERSSFDIIDSYLEPVFGFKTLPADSNKPTIRIDSCRYFLDREIETSVGMVPALIIDPRCEMIIGGMKGGYHYKVMARTGSSIKYQSEPNKNDYSHPHDALQYLTLDIKNRHGLTAILPRQ